jgi:hypothetical protein
MPIKRIQRIAAILFLVCLISPIVIIFSSYLLTFLQTKAEKVIYTWRTHPHVIIAMIRYHAIAWVTGLFGLIIFRKLRSIIWRQLSQLNGRYLLIGIIIVLFCGSFSFLASGQSTTLYCERIRDTCELELLRLNCLGTCK